MLEHLRKTRKNTYRAVVCNVFRIAIFEKWYLAIFIFSGKIPFPSDRLSKCFRGLLISPKHFLTISKFISPYLGFLLDFNEERASFNSFVDSEIFSIILCVWFKKLVNDFEVFGTFLGKFDPTFVKKVIKFFLLLYLLFQLFLFFFQ